MKTPIAILFLALRLAAQDCAPSRLTDQETLARFQELDRAAQAAFDAGRYPAAALQYREAACLVPKSARAFYGLGVAEAAAQNFPAARDALETAYSLAPSNAAPLATLIRVNVAMKDVDRVKAVLRTAAERFTIDAGLHAGLARFLAENQLIDLGLAESLRAAQAGANDPAAATALAALENTLGAYEDAIRTAAPIELQPGLPDAVRASAAGVTGLSYEASGRRDDAIRHLQAAISLAPGEENSYLALAFLYQKAQRYQDAVDVLTRAQKRFPNSATFLLPLGNNLVWARHYQPGIQILNDVIAASPSTAEAYIRLAEAYRDTDRTELEIGALRRLTRVQPDYPMLPVLIAQAMMRMAAPNYPGVLAELAEAERSAPNDPDISYLRGKVYLGMNRNQDAVAALTRAIELNPLDSAPYYQLGLAYRKLGQPELAREILGRMQRVKEAEKP